MRIFTLAIKVDETNNLLTPLTGTTVLGQPSYSRTYRIQERTSLGWWSSLLNTQVSQSVSQLVGLAVWWGDNLTPSLLPLPHINYVFIYDHTLTNHMCLCHVTK